MKSLFFTLIQYFSKLPEKNSHFIYKPLVDFTCLQSISKIVKICILLSSVIQSTIDTKMNYVLLMTTI